MGWSSSLATVLQQGLDALFPRACRLCSAGNCGGWDCERHPLPARPPGERCPVCGLELPAGLAAGGPCWPCRLNPPPWSRLVCLGDYRQDEGLRPWILAFKHGRRADLAAPLGALLAARFLEDAAPGSSDLLVPVPLHPLRRLERGHDQALELARALERTLERSMECAPVVRVRRALLRRRPTHAQGSARGESLVEALGGRGGREGTRATNVRGAFVLEPDERRHLAGRFLWLVDDVVTSGHTAAECARVLAGAGTAVTGIEGVGVLCLARAAPSSGGGLGTLCP